jgi:hypothetical protein
VLHDPEHWCSRAEAARLVAEHLSDPVAREMMLQIAKDYERPVDHVRQEAAKNREALNSSSF